MALERRRIDHREDTRTGEADQADQHQHAGRCMGEPECDHGGDGGENVNPEVADIAHAHEQERTEQCADRTADKVDARSDSGLLDGVSAALDEQLGCDRIHAHIDAHDEDDAEEKDQHRAVLQQREGRSDRRSRLRFARLADRGAEKPEGRQQRDGGIDREEVLPVAQLSGGECGDERSAERRHGFDHLSGRERAGQRLGAHDIRQQRVERHLQQRVADAQQGEGRHAGDQIVIDEGDEHAGDGDEVARLHHLLAPDAVHDQCRGNREQQEPDEDHRGDESGEGLVECEIFLHVAGRDTHHVAESHHEETEEDGQQFAYGAVVVFIHRIVRVISRLRYGR